MIYSIFRWTYFSYPSYEPHFKDMISTAFDEEIFNRFLYKSWLHCENGDFNLIVQNKDFHNFCTVTESRIWGLCSNGTETAITL